MRFCVQVKNKPCVRCTSNMGLISWIRPHGSETVITHDTWDFKLISYTL